MKANIWHSVPFAVLSNVVYENKQWFWVKVFLRWNWAQVYEASKFSISCDPTILAGKLLYYARKIVLVLPGSRSAVGSVSKKLESRNPLPDSAASFLVPLSFFVTSFDLTLLRTDKIRGTSQTHWGYVSTCVTTNFPCYHSSVLLLPLTIVGNVIPKEIIAYLKHCSFL